MDQQAGPGFLAGGGELGALMRAHDWPLTPLGMISAWPLALRTLVAVMLGSKQPMFVAWGAERTLLYNDGYAEILARKHPHALGRPLMDVWSEIRDDLAPIVGQAFAGEAVHMDDITLVMERRGYPEETHFAFSYTPVRDESGQVAGIFCACRETTGQVLAERRNLAERERFEQLFAQAPSFMAMLHGPEHVIELANPAYMQLVGHRDVLGKPIRQALPEVEGQGYFELLDAVYAKGEAFKGTGMKAGLQRRPGDAAEERVLDFVFQPVTDGEGRITGIFVEGSDVTERVQAEERLRESEARLGFLDRLGAETAPLADADAVLATTTRLLGEHLNLSICAYADMDGDQDGFTIRGNWAAQGSKSIVGHYSLADFGKLAVRNLGAGLPLVVNDNLSELPPEDAAAFQGIGIAATICMPLVKEGRLAALMAIHDRAPRIWTEAELGLLREVTARSWAHVERVAATAELRASEARFRLMADAVPQVVWITDAEGRVEFFNKQWSDYTGVPYQPTTAAEVAAAHVHPDDEASTVAAFNEARRTGRTYLVEHRIRSAAGDYRWFLVRGEPHRDPSTGEVVRWFGASVDIHDRRQAEARLRRSEAALRELNETLESRVAELAAERDQIWRLSRAPFVVCDAEGRWLSASPAWTDILGWTQAELIGRTSEWMEHPDDRIKTRGKVVDAAADEVMLNMINRFRDRDGHYHSFSWTAVAEGDRLFCVARDVTEEMERAAALRLYANIVQSDPSPVCAFDMNYRLIAFNQAHNDEFHRVNGFYTQVGDVFPDLFIPEQRPVMRALMSRALSGELFTIVEEFGRPELGRPYWEISYTPLRDEMGQITGAFHHARDISSRLHAEAELAAAQEALRQSQKMEAVGQLTGGIAHDFNNLLAGISGSLELLQARMAQGRTNELGRYIQAAQGAAKRAAALTHRLLAFTRRQTLDPKPTDMNRLVAGMEELVRRTVGPAVAVEVVGAAGLWTTLVDPNQLENALLNLCVNARDAMPDGGRLTVETGNRWLDERAARERGLQPGHYVSLSVSDTGTGMTPEVIRRAFDPFFTTKPIGVGTGLGLSMVYGFVQQSGGQVRITSEPGQGAMVCLYLPRHDGQAEGGVEPAQQAAAPRAEAGETVLVIDDEPTVRMLVTEVLEDLGYTAIEAGDGAAGLSVLQSDVRLDLLITDVGLPGGMNGRQVADAGRAVRPDLKVLFITGYAENAVLSHGHLDPGMYVMTKPFAIDVLASRIRELIVGPGGQVEKQEIGSH